jgi:hypothetical protein
VTDRAVWRPTASLARVLVWVLAAYAALQVLAIPYDSGESLVRMHPAFEAAFDGRIEDANRLANRVGESGSSVMSLLNFVSVMMMVLLIVWAWRTAKNTRALGRTGERISPVLGIFGWFIPVASWVLPYLVVSDLWRGSDPQTARGTEWRRLPGTVVVRAWWLCFAGGQIVTGLAVLLAVSGRHDVEQTDTLLTVAHTISAVAGVLTIAVVREITRRQLALHDVEPLPLASVAQHAPMLASAVPGEAGWYGDPAGKHEQRYWDGAAWTERVTSAGVQSFAPITPPDWYRDPTGRFPLRYWTGYSWTEHVSRDQELFVDPL